MYQRIALLLSAAGMVVAVACTQADRNEVKQDAAATTGELKEEAREARDEVREEAREAKDKADAAAHEGKVMAENAADRTVAATKDAAITATVKTKFLADSMVGGLNIDVDTNGGVVTLNGMAKSKAESDKAAMIARNTDGVARVVNHIKVAH